MFSHSKTEKVSNENIVLDFLKGILVAMLISLGLIVLFAFCLKWFNWSDSCIVPVTFLIKGASVLVGSVIAVKGNSKGLVKGVCFGAIYIIVAFLVFSLLAGSFSLELSSLLDFVFASLLGGIVGIVKVNRK
jgi:putative membrane protein (TIGR04086 family)